MPAVILPSRMVGGYKFVDATLVKKRSVPDVECSVDNQLPIHVEEEGLLAQYDCPCEAESLEAGFDLRTQVVGDAPRRLLRKVEPDETMALLGRDRNQPVAGMVDAGVGRFVGDISQSAG